MASDRTRKASLNEFVYKLKCLEKELYLVSQKLKDTYKKNEHLSKELESEKEKCRKKAARLKEVEAQLASVEFKLKVRSNQKTKTKDAHVQQDYFQLESNNDVYTTMKNLRSTALETLNSIRGLIIGQGNGFNIKQIEDYQDSMINIQNKKDLDNAEDNQEDKFLNNFKVVNTKDAKAQTLDAMSLHVNVSSRVLGADALSAISGKSKSICNTIRTAEFEDIENSKWEDPEYPYKLLKEMQRNVKRLKANKYYGMGDSSQSNMAAMLDQMEARNTKIKKKINQHYEQ